MHNISECFHAHLEAKKAINGKLKKDAHQIRYDVYCVERGYEDQTKFPDRMEKDEFDCESVHAVVRHKTSERPVGVVRLVLPNPNTPDRLFPIEKHFGHHFEKAKLNKFHFSRNTIAEVSRFAVSRQALKQIHTQLGAGIIDTEQLKDSGNPKHLLPHISLGLIAMLFDISREHGISYWYAAMEPSLSRLLTRLGIRFTPIGPIMDYHGTRQPMIAKVSDLLDNIQRNRKDFFKLITDIGGTAALEERMAQNESNTHLLEANSY